MSKLDQTQLSFVLATLANDEASTDAELLKHFVSQGLDRNACGVLIAKRTRFMKEITWEIEMQRTEQVAFIEEITDGLKASLLERAKYIPEHWNGSQIRRWMTDLSRELYLSGSWNQRNQREYEKDRLSHPGL